MTKLTFPFADEKNGALKVGDEVLICGVGFSRTGEDALSYFEIIASGRRTRQFLGRG